MIDDDVIEKIYRELLEEQLISYLAQVKGMSLEKAMSVYYKSKLADMIEEGRFGIQYLDHKVLVDILLDTEPELFEAAEVS